MKLKYITPFLILPLLSCADGADPDTVSRDELSPPLNLVTVTGSEAIELRWNGQNFEDELKGYHVFMVENKTIAQIAADSAVLPQYPPLDYTAAQLRQSSVPRCEQNNSFYELFGIEVGSDESCDSSLFATQSNTEEADDGASILAAKQACYDPDNPETNLGNENVSVAVSSADYQDGEGVQRCLIKGLTNGTNYSFIVVAVLGNDFDEISWSSNLVDDTPAPVVYDSEITIGNEEYVKFTIDPTAITATLSAAQTCVANSMCSIVSANDETAGADIFLGRDNLASANYRQRLALSTSSAGSANIVGRGPMTIDPLLGSDTIATRIPGDQALTASGDIYYTKGLVLGVYENSVFDFYVTSGEDSYYGKIILHDYSYGEAATSDLTVKVTVVLQPAANNTNYMTSH